MSAGTVEEQVKIWDLNPGVIRSRSHIFSHLTHCKMEWLACPTHTDVCITRNNDRSNPSSGNLGIKEESGPLVSTHGAQRPYHLYKNQCFDQISEIVKRLKNIRNSSKTKRGGRRRNQIIPTTFSQRERLKGPDLLCRLSSLITSQQLGESFNFFWALVFSLLCNIEIRIPTARVK